MKYLWRTLAGVALLAACACEPSSPDPVLEVFAADFDAGVQIEGDRFEHSFRFRNAGGAPLHIEQVRASCGCVHKAVSVRRDGRLEPWREGSPIPPGGEGEVAVAMDARHSKSGQSRRTAVVRLVTDDPRGPIPLTITYQVERLFRVEPASLCLSDAAPLGGVATVQVVAERGEVEVVGVSCESPQVLARWEPSASRCVPVSLDVSAPAGARVLSTEVEIEVRCADDGRRRTVQVPLVAVFRNKAASPVPD